MKKVVMINRTGGKISPQNLLKTIEGAEEYSPYNDGDSTTLNEIREQYANDSDGPLLIGTVPPATTLQPAAPNMSKQIQGKDLTVLMDKLSERIAFESTGTRLYEALISKCSMAPLLPPGFDMHELMHIRNEEHEHLLMLIETVEELGGDPTALTPCADASATATAGICKVVSDPRTTVLQALDAMLIAELTDNDGWSLLITVCQELGLSMLTERFEKALEQEDEHLENVRKWLIGGVVDRVGSGEGRSDKSSTIAKTKRSEDALKKAAAQSKAKSSAARGKSSGAGRATRSTVTRAKSKNAASASKSTNGSRAKSSKSTGTQTKAKKTSISSKSTGGSRGSKPAARTKAKSLSVAKTTAKSKAKTRSGTTRNAARPKANASGTASRGKKNTAAGSSRSKTAAARQSKSGSGSKATSQRKNASQSKGSAKKTSSTRRTSK